MTSPTEYSIESLLALKDTLPLISVHYGTEETGWAIDLGEGRACIANTPLEPRLHYLDVVELGPPTKGCCSRPTVREVLWRGYACKTGVQYPAGNKETAKSYYKRLFHACKKAGLPIEGFAAGTCGVSHQEETNLQAVLEKAGIDTSELTLRTDW